MSALADFLITALALAVFAFIILGAVGGWFVIFALLEREQKRDRQAQLDALDAASHPVVGRRAA